MPKTSKAPQTSQLVAALKRRLKAQGISYRDLARQLGLSEASIKRVFAEETFTLDRFEQVCAAAGTDFYAMAKASRPEHRDEAETLTREQEAALAGEPRLFAFFYLLLAGLKPAQLRQRYRFTELESERALLKLDRLGLIELGPQERVRQLVTRNVRWAERGPLYRLYEQEIKRELLQSDFAGGLHERFRLLNGHLSERSLRTLSRKIDKLIGEFVDLSEDRREDGKAQKIWFLLAYRPWEFSAVHKLRRSNLNQ